MPLTAPLVDQELVVHVFFPLGGPQHEAAYRQVTRLWSACRSQLGMTEPIPGIPAPAPLPQPGAARPADGDGVVAAQQSPDAGRQAVLRQVHDVLNMSVALAQPVPEGDRRLPAAGLTRRPAPGIPSGRPLGWAEWAQIWSQASAPGADAALGEARLFLARAPGGGAVAATADLGQSAEPLLPYREDRAREWWRRGAATSAGYAVWDTCHGDTDPVREIVAIGAADRADELSAWAWSDGTPDLPPFGRYLMHTAKLRYEARLLDSWGRDQDSWGRDQGRGDIDEMVAELGVALAPDAPHPAKAELLRSRLSRLRAEEIRLNDLHAGLERLSTTVAIARGNLAEVAGSDSGEGAAGLFGADQALARWLALQLEDYLGYLRTDLAQTRRARELAAGELDQPASTAAPSPGGDDATRRVFVVHGRDTRLVGRFFDLLRAAGLRPLEWEALVEATGIATPWLGAVVARAPHVAQATLVLLSPDDIVELHSDLFLDSDGPQERGRAGQARPNVLFELGLALMAYPERTVIVEVGDMRPLSDLAGLNVIRFDGSSAAISKVVHRLEMAGACPVDHSGNDWLDHARFADLPSYRRGPGNHQAGGS